MYKVTTTWESVEDRIGNPELNAERLSLLNKLIEEGKAPSDAPIWTPKNSPIGIIKVNDLEAAKEWENILFLLAERYNKRIVFVSKEEI